MENAKVYAEDVIRNRKEAIQLRRFGVKMGALASKIESAARTMQVSETISNSIPMMQKAMEKMDSIGVS
jgi:charged multivesicular body protein 1